MVLTNQSYEVASMMAVEKGYFITREQCKHIALSYNTGQTKETIRLSSRPLVTIYNDDGVSMQPYRM